MDEQPEIDGGHGNRAGKLVVGKIHGGFGDVSQAI